MGRENGLQGWQRIRVGHGEGLVGCVAALGLLCVGMCIGLDVKFLGIAMVAPFEEVAGFER